MWSRVQKVTWCTKLYLLTMNLFLCIHITNNCLQIRKCVILMLGLEPVWCRVVCLWTHITYAWTSGNKTNLSFHLIAIVRVDSLVLVSLHALPKVTPSLPASFPLPKHNSFHQCIWTATHLHFLWTELLKRPSTTPCSTLIRTGWLCLNKAWNPMFNLFSVLIQLRWHECEVF